TSFNDRVTAIDPAEPPPGRRTHEGNFRRAISCCQASFTTLRKIVFRPAASTGEQLILIVSRPGYPQWTFGILSRGMLNGEPLPTTRQERSMPKFRFFVLLASLTGSLIALSGAGSFAQNANGEQFLRSIYTTYQKSDKAVDIGSEQ